MTIQLVVPPAVEKHLNDVLNKAIEAAYESGQAIRGAILARQVYASEPELMDELKEPWMVERLAWQINRKRGHHPRIAA